MKPHELELSNLGELLSELLGRREQEDFWSRRLPLAERSGAYLRLAGQLGSRYAQATLDNYEIYDKPKGDVERRAQGDVLEAVRSWAEAIEDHLRGGGGLVLFGRPGTGKDHLLAACLYWSILRHGWTVRWWDGAMLAQEIRSRVGSDRETEKGLVKELSEPQILAISDLVPVKGDTSAWVADTLQRIIDRRYRRGVSTWATINVRDGREAEERLAAPVIDRLRHSSLCLQCDWESYRRRTHG